MQYQPTPKITNAWGDVITLRIVEVARPAPGVEAAEVWIAEACVAEIVTAGSADRHLTLNSLCAELQGWICQGATPFFGVGDWPVVRGAPDTGDRPCWRLAEDCAADLLRLGADADTVLDLLGRDVPVRWSARAQAAAAVDDARRAPDADGQFRGKLARAYQISRAFADLSQEVVRAAQDRLGVGEGAARAWLIDAAGDAR